MLSVGRYDLPFFFFTIELEAEKDREKSSYLIGACSGCLLAFLDRAHELMQDF
jgi:hypothetical protein